MDEIGLHRMVVHFSEEYKVIRAACIFPKKWRALAILLCISSAEEVVVGAGLMSGLMLCM